MLNYFFVFLAFFPSVIGLDSTQVIHTLLDLSWNPMDLSQQLKLRHKLVFGCVFQVNLDIELHKGKSGDKRGQVLYDVDLFYVVIGQWEVSKHQSIISENGSVLT